MADDGPPEQPSNSDNLVELPSQRYYDSEYRNQDAVGDLIDAVYNAGLSDTNIRALAAMINGRTADDTSMVVTVTPFKDGRFYGPGYTCLFLNLMPFPSERKEGSE